MFTQPLMYKTIEQQEPVAKTYGEQLIADGIVTREEYQAEHDKYDKICEEAYQEGKKITSITFRDWLDSPWKGTLIGYIHVGDVR